jgi:succinate-semialdehyde dehydrogenase/glutarate-semialdehyde dehydrogenase
MTNLNLADKTLLTECCRVGDHWIAPNKEAIAVTNPFDGSHVANVPSLSAGEVEAAIKAAKNAMPAWRATPAKERAKILRRWFDLIVENADDLAQILTAEQGKPLAEAKAEIISNAAYLEWFAEEAKRIEGDYMAGPQPSQRILVMKQPIGVCAAITPWNFPNGMITRKAGPALAAGCPMVLKPASQTPLSALSLAVLAERAGVPAGVFSVVTGRAREIGEIFTSHPDIAKISFTGSTEVGRWLIKAAANDIKRLSLELGGNAPFLVFDDADLEAAAEGALLSKYRNAGQTCVCANRIYVQASVAEAFTQKLVEKAAALKLGSGFDETVTVGPLIDEAAVKKMQSHVDDALAKGGRLVLGGKRAALGSTFYEPTVITEATQEMLVASEETFAPLAAIIKFKDESEGVAMANASEFGLAAYFYAKDMARIIRVGEALESGMVGVNTPALANEVAPFGGVKQSGLGREGSKYGIEEYLEIKYLALGGIG